MRSHAYLHAIGTFGIMETIFGIGNQCIKNREMTTGLNHKRAKTAL